MSSNSLAFWRSHHLLHRLTYPSGLAAKEAPALFPPAQLCADQAYLTHPYLTVVALASFLSAVMREIPVSYLLNIMAGERAKYVAAMVSQPSFISDHGSVGSGIFKNCSYTDTDTTSSRDA